MRMLHVDERCTLVRHALTALGDFSITFKCKGLPLHDPILLPVAIIFIIGFAFPYSILALPQDLGAAMMGRR